MQGAITQQLDAVQVLVAAFFVFFAGLVYYLRREDKREGYPLIDHSPRGVPIQGFPDVPPTKVYRLLEGGVGTMPNRYEPSAMRGVLLDRFPGAPMVPLGDPMFAEIGPGAYPLRIDHPFMDQGEPQVQPVRKLPGWDVSEEDPDPRGMAVHDAARVPVGIVSDLWVDRGVKILRYLEVRLDDDEVPVLVPIFHTSVSGRRRVVTLRHMLGGYLRTAPRLQSPDEITAREEDRVNAYFASAPLFGRVPPRPDVPTMAPSLPRQAG